MSHKILLLPGDGIGPEVVGEAKRILQAAGEKYGFQIAFSEADIGGVAIERQGNPYPDTTRELASKADAILLGAVGGPQWDSLPTADRPERGLLSIRADLDLFCNLRPALLYRQIADASSLKPELVADLDLLIVRELTGGVYFGEPRGIRELENGERQGFNTDIYSESEIRRIAHLGFQFARKRNKRLSSVDKANVLEVTMLWRDIVSEVAFDYPDVELSHIYVDNAAMQLVRAPKQFDVMLTGNLFGDILSDTAAMLTGSIGMLPSASMNAEARGLYEPVHGSAPDIAGQGKANPVATILSAAMLLRYSLNEDRAAAAIEAAVQTILDQGLRTLDIATDDEVAVSTETMGNAVVNALLNNE